MIIQKVQQQITLLLLQPHNIPRKLGVHVNRLFTGDGVAPDNGVDMSHGSAADDALAVEGGVGLLHRRVDSLQTVEALTEGGGETAVGFGLVGEEGITTGRRAFKEVEESGSRGLAFIRDVGMPRNAVCPRLQKPAGGQVALGAVDEVDLWVTLGRAAGGVDVVSPKVRAEIEGGLDGQVGKVLVAEDDDLLLRNKQRQFIFPRVVETRQLDPRHLGSEGGGQITDIEVLVVLGEEVGEGRIGAVAGVDVLKGSQWGVDGVVPDGEVVRVCGGFFLVGLFVGAGAKVGGFFVGFVGVERDVGEGYVEFSGGGGEGGEGVGDGRWGRCHCRCCVCFFVVFGDGIDGYGR